MHMIDTKTQAQPRTTLEHIIAQNTLLGQLSAFFLCCKVDELLPKTLDDYESKLRVFVRFCSSIGVETAENVNATHVRLFLLDLQQRCSPVSVGDYYHCVKRFFDWIGNEALSRKIFRAYRRQ